MRLETKVPRRLGLAFAPSARPAVRFGCGAHVFRRASTDSGSSPRRDPEIGEADEDWISSGRWSAAFALALLLHLPLLRMAALTDVDETQWLTGHGRGAGSEAVSVYDLYLVTAKASAVAATVSAAPDPGVNAVAQAGASAPAETGAQAKAATKPAAVVLEAGGGGQDGYYARLRAHLQHYRWPIQAQAAGARTVLVRFRVDGRGGVSAIGLQRSSGDPQLDAEALDLVRRSAPVPQPPHGQAMNLAVPIAFE